MFAPVTHASRRFLPLLPGESWPSPARADVPRVSCFRMDFLGRRSRRRREWKNTRGRSRRDTRETRAAEALRERAQLPAARRELAAPRAARGARYRGMIRKAWRGERGEGGEEQWPVRARVSCCSAIFAAAAPFFDCCGCVRGALCPGRLFFFLGLRDFQNRLGFGIFGGLRGFFRWLGDDFGRRVIFGGRLDIRHWAIGVI